MAKDYSKIDFNNADTMTTEQLVFMAKRAETAERYDDMCQFMKFLVHKKIKLPPATVTTGEPNDLTTEQRNLLSVAYKNVIGARRATWRSLNEVITDLKNTPDKEAKEEEKINLLEIYKNQIEKELKHICTEVLDLLNKHLLVATKDKRDESEVFYLKMTADYYRYLVEFSNTEENKNLAAENYAKALAIAKDTLKETHPIRLGLALNYSVCYYEILNKPELACQLAKQSFDSAIAQLDSLDENSYKDSTLIMQLLRDNLTLWTTDGAAQENQGDG